MTTQADLSIQSGLSVHDAVGLAYVRKATRLAAIRDELADLGWDGFITPADLLLLEDNGFLLDFDSGRVVDTHHVVTIDAPALVAS